MLLKDLLQKNYVNCDCPFLGVIDEEDNYMYEDKLALLLVRLKSPNDAESVCLELNDNNKLFTQVKTKKSRSSTDIQYLLLSQLTQTALMK